MRVVFELHHALRRLGRRPLLAALVVLILAVGIGANTAVFSLLYGVVLDELPLPDPESVVYLGEADPDGTVSNLGFATYVDLAARAKRFERLAVASWWSPTLHTGDEARTVHGRRVSASFLPTLGLVPAMGRNFTAEEDRPEAPRVVMLAHGTWRGAFASDPAIVGRQIQINEIPYEVVGVLPPELDRLLGPGPGRRLDLIAPLRYDVSQSWACRSCGHLFAIGRLAAGSDLDSARAELDALFAVLKRDFPSDYPTDRGAVVPMSAELTRAGRPLLGALYVGVALVLLLVAANVAALLAVRAIERRHELAIRRSLGASSRQLFAAAWSEPIVLAVAGTAGGLVLAAPLLRLFVSSGSLDLPRLDAVGLSLPVLVFTAVASFVVTLLAGSAAARLHLRTSARASLVAARVVGREDRRWLSRLVAGELAAALTILFAAGLVTRSLGKLLGEDPGFRSVGVVVASVSTTGPRYEEDAPTHAFFDRALERVEAIPGVDAAGWTSLLPLGGNFDRNGLRFHDRPEIPIEQTPSADRFAVTHGYFRAMGIRLVAGRFLLASDVPLSEPVVLLNRGLVERIWPDESGLGKLVRLGNPESPWRRVVGVVDGVRQVGLDRPSEAQIYLPASQWSWADSDRTLVVRSDLSVAALARPIREAIRTVDALRPVEGIAAMDEVIAQSVGRQRFASGLWSAFALLALLLAAIGTFGLLARSLALRRREFGVRAALGAEPLRLAGEVALDALRLVGLAVLLALPATWGLGRLLAAQLWKVPAGDPETLGLAVAVVAATAALATASPARRAARVDPAAVLRDE
ncbi:MAG TPA: ADOP family duplicated permease [Thermoanaerobaculia bacterium]